MEPWEFRNTNWHYRAKVPIFTDSRWEIHELPRERMCPW